MAPFELTLLTDDPRWAAAGDAAGVDFVGVDTERMGKAERQRAVHDARIHAHTLADLARYAPDLRRAKAFARLNPPHPGLRAEVEAALDAGAKVLMLPQFRDAGEAESFVRLVDGRAKVQLLVETPAAVEALPELLRVGGVDGWMIGLNDLHLALGFRHPLEVALSPWMERMAGQFHAAGAPFGFGGVARPDQRGLPVDPDGVLALYAVWGARSAWISRSFFAGGLAPAGFTAAVLRVRARLAEWRAAPPGEWARARAGLAAQVAALPGRGA